jgi:hypothetical protein
MKGEAAFTDLVERLVLVLTAVSFLTDSVDARQKQEHDVDGHSTTTAPR